MSWSGKDLYPLWKFYIYAFQDDWETLYCQAELLLLSVVFVTAKVMNFEQITTFVCSHNTFSSR